MHAHPQRNQNIKTSREIKCHKNEDYPPRILHNQIGKLQVWYLIDSCPGDKKIAVTETKLYDQSDDFTSYG